MRDDKFLVQLINNISKKDLFIGIWLLSGAFISYLMWSYYKKANQRNFRESKGTGRGSSSVVVQKNIDNSKDLSKRN